MCSPSRIELSSSLSDKNARWFIKQIALKGGHFEEIKNDKIWDREGFDLTPMDGMILAKAFIKAKCWSNLYSFLLTEGQISKILSEIAYNEESRVESLDLVDFNFDHVPPRELAHSLMNVRSVRLHHISFDSLYELFDMIIRRDSGCRPLKEITFLQLSSLPNHLDKNMMRIVADKVTIRVNSMLCVCPDLKSILSVKNKCEAWWLSRPHNFVIYHDLTNFLFAES